MKSERRHELQHNALADWLAKSAAAVKPYQNIALTAAVVLLAAVLGYTWWARQSAAQTTKAWAELGDIVNSGDVSKFNRILDLYPDTNAAHTAALVLADHRLAEACDRLFTNKAVARGELDKAIELYQLVRKESSSRVFLERATYGLARAKEAKGELPAAEQLYKEITDRWPDGAYGAAASGRLADLKRPATKAFYDQFAKFDPKPAFSGEPGEKPSFDLDSLPKEGPADLPSIGDLKLGGEPKDKNEPKKKE